VGVYDVKPEPLYLLLYLVLILSCCDVHADHEIVNLTIACCVQVHRNTVFLW